MGLLTSVPALKDGTKLFWEGVPSLNSLVALKELAPHDDDLRHVRGRGHYLFDRTREDEEFLPWVVTPHGGIGRWFFFSLSSRDPGLVDVKAASSSGYTLSAGPTATWTDTGLSLILPACTSGDVLILAASFQWQGTGPNSVGARIAVKNGAAGEPVPLAEQMIAAGVPVPYLAHERHVVKKGGAYVVKIQGLREAATTLEILAASLSVVQLRPADDREDLTKRIMSQQRKREAAIHALGMRPDLEQETFKMGQMADSAMLRKLFEGAE